MSDAVIKLIVLAAVAIFLVLKLRSVLGTRDGFEKPIAPAAPTEPAVKAAPSAGDVIENGPDRDITDQVPAESEAAQALTAMKLVEPSFKVGEFLQGARAAYEMIVMAFETGDLEKVRPFLAPEVFTAFETAVDARKSRGLTVTAEFMGLRELALADARFDRGSNDAEIVVRFGSEILSVARDASGAVVEGDAKTPRKQRDVWTFSRVMGSADPNWRLVATGG